MSSVTEQIKERLDIVDVLSSYIKVEKAGVNFKAKCPFHNEKTASFFISPSRQTFYCFGCGEKGDIFSFVEKFEGLDFRGALESLAKRAGVEIKPFEKEDRALADQKEHFFQIMEEATKFYEKKLLETKGALDYLKKRGVSDSSIKDWRIGFAPDEWRSLYDYLTANNIKREEMLSVGLIKKVPSEDKFYDTFRNRIVFPISDTAGRVIAFSGRAMREDEKTPKYLNSPETKLFYKSEALHGFHLAKNHIRKMDYAVLVEGQMDLILSHQAGVANTVASSGTALTALHLKKIQKLSNRVIIAYDSDEAGEKAASKAATMALSLGMEAKIASLPEGEDPASVAKDDPEKWKDALRKSEHFIDFTLRSSLRAKNPVKEVSAKVLPLMNFLKSEIEKAKYIKKISFEMGVPEEAVWNDFKKTAAPEVGDITEESTFQKDRKIINLDRIGAGIVFLEEAASESKFKQRWEEIAGKEEVEAKIEEFGNEKEALIFEIENGIGEDDLQKTGNDVLRRIELHILKQKLQRTAYFLDQNVTADEDKLKKEIESIQKRILELSSLK